MHTTTKKKVFSLIFFFSPLPTTSASVSLNSSDCLLKQGALSSFLGSNSYPLVLSAAIKSKADIK